MLDNLHGAKASLTWEWFIDRYRPAIRGILVRALGPDRAEQASDEFWSYLFTSKVFERADRTRRFRSFLWGVVSNYARDWSRRNHHPQRTQESPEPEPTVEDTFPEEDLRHWSRHVLNLALQSLAATHPDDEKTLRWFYAIPGPDEPLRDPLPVTEIATRLGRKPNAVHQVLHRGRSRLRGHIESELRETVNHDAELREELELMLGAIGRDVPGVTER